MQDIVESPSGEYRAELRITNELGLHARPAALLVKTAQSFDAELVLFVAGREANAKSILDILALAATRGSALCLHGRGPEAREAVEAVAALVRRQFKEEAA